MNLSQTPSDFARHPEKQRACLICGSERFRTLPVPWPFSMTTGGLFIPEPLAKEQCLDCGLLVRGAAEFLGQRGYYQKSYAFFERPGADLFDRPRYEAMAEWITGALNDFEPQSALDAGCGRGWMMQALQAEFPRARFAGVEPSEQESEIARRRGWSVKTATIDDNYQVNQRYDLVYCTNVIEHSTDPIDFLSTLRRMIAPGGRVLVTCPDASHANAEFMFSDQNFSFAPEHLLRMAEKADLHPIKWIPAPLLNSLRDKQLFVFGARPGLDADFDRESIGKVVPDELFNERAQYIASYVECDRYLTTAVSSSERVYNFGTSTWTMLLRAYCPAYWARVDACMIDGGSGDFHGKPVLDFGSMQLNSDDAVVLGVNPFSQQEFATRLRQSGTRCITWSHIIMR